MTNLGKTTLKVGLTVGFTLGAIVGLVGCADETNDGVEGQHQFGIPSGNGVGSGNGIYGTNGVNSYNGIGSGNGIVATNGIPSGNGIGAVNGMSSTNGISSNNGYITTDAGRKTLAYLIKCALPSGHSISKTFGGQTYTFEGSLGLCPQWENGPVWQTTGHNDPTGDRKCQNRVSACMLAHINTSGVHVPLWLDSEGDDGVTPVGWGTDPGFPNQEGTFFGNIIATGNLSYLSMPAVTAPAAFYCEGAGITAGVVSGRLVTGAMQNAPYTNPFGAGVKCQNGNTTPGPYSNGHTAPDGYKTAYAGNYTYQNGETITVWRNPNYTPVFDSVYRYGLSPMHVSGKSIDVCNGSTTNGTCIQQYGSWATDNQRFVVTKSGTSSNWQVSMKSNPAKCMGPVGNGTANLTRMEVQDCNAGNNQAWTITADANTGGFQLQNVASNRCLDVNSASTADGAPMELWDCNGGLNQKFKVSVSY